MPGYRKYVAYVDETPAAVASLYVSEGVGFLVLGATAPTFQRRGCHTALIHRRLGDSANMDCDVVAVTTAIGSTSQHNMERAGFRIAYTMSTWTDGM